MRAAVFAPILYGMLSLAGACKAITSPKAPGLELLYTLNVTSGEPIAVGPGPRGIRLIVPLTGGTFSGPKLKGKPRQPLNCLIPTRESCLRPRRNTHTHTAVT